jgi:hypothetical protein
VDRDELQALSANWDSRWGGSPIAYELRDRWADRWVRFHSLPDSKRYAETEEEYRILLDRHHTVLTGLGVGDGLYAIAGYFEDTAGRSRPDPSVHPGAVLWQTLQPNHETFFELPVQLYASKVSRDRTELDPFLRAVADEALSYAIIAPTDLRWLYHPYDGGADVIAPGPHDRDMLRARHSSWLSAYP